MATAEMSTCSRTSRNPRWTSPMTTSSTPATPPSSQAWTCSACAGKRVVQLAWRTWEKQQPSACLAELLRPAAQHSIVRLLDIDKFDAHADAGLYDAHHSKRFHFFIFPCQRDPYARVGRQRLAGANKNSTHGQVGSHTFRPRSAFQIQHECVRSKRIADTKAAVPDRNAPGVAIRCAVVHENNVAHSQAPTASNRP